MKYDTALAWLRGERSMTNILQVANDPQSHVRVQQADAALTEQAYWVVRAHEEGLINADE